MAVSVAGDGFVEIEDEIGDQGPRGDFGGGLRGGGFAFAGGEDFSRGRWIGGVVRAVRGEGFGEQGALGAIGSAGRHRAKREREALGVVARLREETLGEGARGLEVMHVVHEREGLERRVGATADDAEVFARRRIEG